MRRGPRKVSSLIYGWDKELLESAAGIGEVLANFLNLDLKP